MYLMNYANFKKNYVPFVVRKILITAMHIKCQIKAECFTTDSFVIRKYKYYTINSVIKKVSNMLTLFWL